VRYTSRELDLESSLVYYRHRFYDPAIGRFLNEDENEFYGGTNFYSYVNNSPLVYVDPFGLARASSPCMSKH
jgi:RHS repeat-associated protein